MYCFDMDGLLAVYNPLDYKPDHNGNMPYMKKDGHYFATRPEDEKMTDVLWQMNDQAEVIVLTRVTNDGPLYLEAVHDKADWLRKHCPFLNIEKQFVPVTDTKERAFKALYGHLNYKDILIDDYPKNLYDWFAAGGYSVKYMNHLNSFDESFPGVILRPEMTSDEITEVLLTLNH